MPRKTISAFFHHEAAGGIVLLAAAVLALIAKNSPLGGAYDALFDMRLGFNTAVFSLHKPLLLWINDGLMSIFFFLVGLEIKRELVEGELSSFGSALLPGIAAVGGMAVPALIYVAINWGDVAALRGWAIPAATDIAFAVGVLALLGPRVPSSLKVFLLALAILDDLGAIIIIALFYTSKLALVPLTLAGLGCIALVVLNNRGVNRFWPYLLIGIFIWVCVLKSGLHATLAGVVLAMAIPLAPGRNDTPSMLTTLEEKLHGWVAFGIVPLFAFANAGVSFAGMTVARLFDGVPLGIMLGLALGKPIGILGATWITTASGLAPRPQGASMLQLLGVGMLGGIGFTMSLFIGMLAFTEPHYAVDLRLGVLSGSLISAIAGFAVLSLSAAPRRP